MHYDADFAIGVPGLEPEKRSLNWGVAVLHLVPAQAGFLAASPLCCGCHHHGQGQLTACKSNLKNIATALEIYSSDNHGQYPATLEKLIPGNYLKVVPTCPAAGGVTYIYHRSTEPDSFRFACAGNNHARAYTGFSTSSNNFPRYSAEDGLIDHP